MRKTSGSPSRRNHLWQARETIGHNVIRKIKWKIWFLIYNGSCGGLFLHKTHISIIQIAPAHEWKLESSVSGSDRSMIGQNRDVEVTQKYTTKTRYIFFSETIIFPCGKFKGNHWKLLRFDSYVIEWLSDVSLPLEGNLKAVCSKLSRRCGSTMGCQLSNNHRYWAARFN